MAQRFLVTGATGQQGGHTARLLLTAGQKVHAIVRDPTAPQASELKSLGAEIFTGDFSSPDSIFAAAQGCFGAFINVSPVLTDPLGERTHIQNILSACGRAGVQKIVQSSTVLADESGTAAFVDLDESSWMGSYLDSKRACEAAVRDSEGCESWTILRPSRLLSSYVAPLAGLLFPDLKGKRLIRTALSRDFKHQVLDPIDVGKVAVKALLDTEGTFKHRTIGLAAKDMTLDEIVGAMNHALGGETVKIEYMGEQEIREAGKENLIVGSEVFLNKNAHRWQLSPDQMRRLGAEDNFVKNFFKREKEALKRAVGL